MTFGATMTTEALEKLARQLSISQHSPDYREKGLVAMVLAFGNHLDECAQVRDHYGVENDCSCGWSSVRYYLHVYERAHGVTS